MVTTRTRKSDDTRRGTWPRPGATALGLWALLALALPCPVAAAEGLFLNWSDCALGVAATQDRANTCTSNSGVHNLIAAFRMPFEADSVLGAEVVVDLQHADAEMPPWWLFAPDSCRAGTMQASFDFSVYNSCNEFWFNEEAGALVGYTVGEPRGGANQARFRMGAAVLPAFGYRTLNATDMYYAARIVISNQRTVGDPSCAGCTGAACLVLNAVRILRKPGAPGGDVLIETPGPGDANRATWQGGIGVNCQAVPTQRTTWGRIKGMYR